MFDAVIGALRATLGFDSAQFDSGIKKAQGKVHGFGVQLTLGLETVAREVGRAIGAIPAAIGSAIDRADELGKMAQSIGVPVEALSRLEYAAKLSDVSLGGLETGLRKLSQSMVAVTTSATGPAATAFAALGISVKNADGSLRGSTAVLGDIADRFATMPDGATKTALAVQLFGRAGADLIPLLNAGSAGLAKMADESDRLGLTISGTTAAAAERFNDTMTTINAVFQGIIAKLSEALLPLFEYLSQAFLDAALDADTMNGFLKGMVEVFKIIVTAGAAVFATIKAIGTAASSLSIAGTLFQAGQFQLAADTLKNGFADIGKTAADATAFIEGLWKAGEAPPLQFTDPPNRGTGGGTPIIPDLAGGARATKKALEEANKAAEKLGQTMQSIGQSVGSSLRGLVDGTKDWRDVLLDVVGSLARIGLDSFKPTGAAGNIAKGLLSGLLGFKDGGLARVTGSGGTDSQLVALRATPGEYVSVGKGDGGPMGRLYVEVGVAADNNGNLMPFVTKVSRGEASRAGAQAVNVMTRSLPRVQSQLAKNKRL